MTFPLFAKIDVNGAHAHPLYRWLKSEKAGVLGTEAIKWNFTKFLVDRDGSVVKRFAPSDPPEKIGSRRCVAAAVRVGAATAGLPAGTGSRRNAVSALGERHEAADSRGRCSSRSGE